MKKQALFVLIFLIFSVGGIFGCVPPVDHLKNGLNFDKQNSFSNAIAEYTKAIELNPNSETAYINRGYDYFRTLQFDLAIADFNKAIEINPNDEIAYLDRGIVYLNQGFKDKNQLNSAIADFSKALTLNPNDDVAYNSRGYAYSLIGQNNLAIADLNKALQLTKDPSIIQSANKILSEIQGTVIQTTTSGGQVWELTENERHQITRVIVSPFTYSGTFTETSNSPGWWIFDTAGNRLYKLPVGGNIFHSSQGDDWQFVNFGNAGGGYQTLGRGEGTANGNFPNSNTVSGSITFTTQSPLGTVTGTVQWSGKRVE